jgi:hypothetical protein
MLQGIPSPTEDDEASTPTEHVRNCPNLNRTFTLRRKAAKRSFPWELTADEIQLASPPPHDEDTRDTERPRLEEPVSTSTDEAASKTTPHDTTVALSPPDAAVNNDDANADPVMDTQPNARITGAKGRWTFVEDGKLTCAVTKTRKKKHGKEFRIDWVAIAALVPGRTKESSVGVDGVMPWIPGSTGWMDVQVHGEMTKIWSLRLRYKITVTPRIGLQLPRWFRVERKFDVETDGIMQNSTSTIDHDDPHFLFQSELLLLH